jgi:hypothetical protein
MLVRKSNFSTWVQFTTNVPDRMLDNHILNSETIDIRPILGDALVNAIRAISDTNPEDYSNTIAYTIGKYAISGAVVYKCIQAHTGQPVTNATYWEESPLGTFWYVYLRPVAVFDAMIMFTTLHGNLVTQFGIVVVPQDSSFPIDGTSRAVMISFFKKAGSVKSWKCLQIQNVELPERYKLDHIRN